MSTDELNLTILQIADKKEQLSSLANDSSAAKAIQKELRELELKLETKFGFVLKGALLDVYDEYAPDIEVSPLIDYIGKGQSHQSVSGYSARQTGGVRLEVDDYIEQDTSLVLEPSPVRLVLNIDDTRKEVWNVDQVITALV